MVLSRIPVSSQFNPVQVFSPCLFKIHFNIISPSKPHLEGAIFPSGFPTKSLHAPLFSPIPSICPSHLIPFGFIAFQSQITKLLILKFFYSPVPSPLFPDPILLTLSAYFGVTYLHFPTHVGEEKKRLCLHQTRDNHKTLIWKRKDSTVSSTKS